jgi:ribosomal protein S13
MCFVVIYGELLADISHRINKLLAISCWKSHLSRADFPVFENETQHKLRQSQQA